MKKILIVTVVVLVLAGGGWWFWRYKHPADKGTVKPTIATVARGNLRVTVVSSGRVVANQEVEVKCKAGGQVTKMPFDVSDTVKAGEMLVELDPVDEQRKVRQSEVSLAASKARLASAGENLGIAERTLKTDRQRADAALKAAESHATDAAQKAARMRELLGKHLVSLEDCETADTQTVQAAADREAARIRIAELETQEKALEVKRQDVALAQAEVDGNTITLSIAQDRLHDTRVLSPIDGVVAARVVQPGQIITSATSNVGGGTSLLTLNDLSRIFVVATVDETDIGKVAVGQKAGITVDAFPNRRFGGEVQRVAVRGVNASNVVTFEVRIEVTSRDKNLLKPEMTANVEITTAQKDNVLTLPLDAVVRKNGEQTVEKVTGETTATTKITVGLVDPERVEVVSGVAEGDKVSYTAGGDGAGKWAGKGAAAGAPRPMMMGMGGGRGGR